MVASRVQGSGVGRHVYQLAPAPTCKNIADAYVNRNATRNNQLVVVLPTGATIELRIDILVANSDTEDAAKGVVTNFTKGSERRTDRIGWYAHLVVNSRTGAGELIIAREIRDLSR